MFDEVLSDSSPVDKLKVEVIFGDIEGEFRNSSFRDQNKDFV